MLRGKVESYKIKLNQATIKTTKGRKIVEDKNRTKEQG